MLKDYYISVMQFGKVTQPRHIDFSLPLDHIDTINVLGGLEAAQFRAAVGCAKWNRQELKGFYPRGTKDELQYYATQFNAIELNATFYKLYSAAQYQKWYAKTPQGFQFFPKLVQDISHYQQLSEGVTPYLDTFLSGALQLQEKLGTIFLQLQSTFSPVYFSRVQRFIEKWPAKVPLAIEFRHTNWYHDPKVSQELYHLMETHNITTIITDTAGRRDLMHMRLTTPEAFIRFVGTDPALDYSRLDDWVKRIAIWKHQGLQKLHFFVHQHIEQESPVLSAYFIQKLNTAIGTTLHIPKSQDDTLTLF